MADLVEISASGAEAAEICRQDLNFLGMLANPEEFSFPFPPFYITLFSLLTAFKSKIERFAIGIPRGFAKTTFIKLLCLWYILFSSRQFILIVGASEALAINTLSDICDLLDSPSIRKLFGNWRGINVEADSQTFKVFNFRGRDIILRAIGAGTAVRGINRKNKRPDVIIMDDVQTRELSQNKELSEELLKWILGTLMLARSNSGCTYIYVGNMYPQNCILEKLKNNSKWVSFVVGGLLADGTSLWEELRPAEELLDEYQSLHEIGQAEIFVCEILNSTDLAPPSGLDVNKIPQLPDYYQQLLADDEAEGGFIHIDPSSGKKTGDDCTLEHYSVIDGKAVLTEIEFGTFTPLETIEKAIAMGMRNNTRLITVEDVAYQSTLLFWFNHHCFEHGITGFEFHPVSPKGQNKNNRIKRGLLSCIAGEIYLAPAVRSLVITQAVDWNPLKINNKDDIIDPLGYVDEIMRTYSEYIVKQLFDVDEYASEAFHATSATLPF